MRGERARGRDEMLEAPLHAPALAKTSVKGVPILFFYFSFIFIVCDLIIDFVLATAVGCNSMIRFVLQRVL